MPDGDGASAPAMLTKMDVIAHLGRARSYRRCLEMSTPSTGQRYAQLDRSVFDTAHRLVYRCPEGFDDGLPIDFRSPDLDLGPCLQAIRKRGFRYDVVFVDPWHEYESSYRSLAVGLDVLADDGTIVVHDCLPPDSTMATLEIPSKGWCGLTYRAFLDFLAEREELDHFTVDIDYGCGVIRRRHRLSRWLPVQRLLDTFLPSGPERSARTAWLDLVRGLQACGQDHLAAFAFFDQHKHALLNLVSVDEFTRRNGDCFGLSQNKTSRGDSLLGR